MSLIPCLRVNLRNLSIVLPEVIEDGFIHKRSILCFTPGQKQIKLSERRVAYPVDGSQRRQLLRSAER